MKLRLRLTLASMVLVLQFLLVAFAVFYWLGGYDIIMLFRPPADSAHLQRIRAPFEAAYQSGGWEALTRSVEYSPLPPGSGVSLFREHTLVARHGPRFPIQSADLARALGGESRHLDFRDRREIWFSLATQPPSALHFVFPQRRPPWFSNPKLWVILLASTVLSGLVALVSGLAISRAISGPAQKLREAIRALEAGEFQGPIAVREHGELRELAEAFNSMSSRLDETVGSLRAAKERAERSEASRRQFMAEASHNLRTPLSAIQGWTEALLDGMVAGEEEVHLRKIRRETVHVAQVVQRLLDWSRWEDLPPALHESTFAVSEPLLETLDALSDTAEARQTTIQLVGLEGEPQVRGDRTRVRDLFQLLIENAVSHTPPGSAIEVVFERQGQRLEVTVRDNGPGLPSQFRDDLTCRCSGGLGLAIADRLALAHGGQLRLLEGSGTSLCFSLELA